MPGDYPAIHQGGWFLLGGSGAGFLALQLPAEVVGLPVLVPLPGHSSRGRPSPRWRISSGGSARFAVLVSPPSRAITLCSPWCSSSISLPFLATQFFVTCCVLFGYLLHPTLFALLPGTSRRFCVFCFPTLFEPLRDAPLRALTKKVLFLLALATAMRVGELQALSRLVSFVGGDACLSYVP